ITIRDCTTADIPLIRDISEKTWWPTYTPILTPDQMRYMLDTIYGEDAVQQVMEDKSQHFILLSHDNVPQGFASYGLRPEDPQVCKLYKIYVLPETHGKGFGKRLIEETKQRLLAQSIHTLDLNVNRYNPARTFYE